MKKKKLLKRIDELEQEIGLIKAIQEAKRNAKCSINLSSESIEQEVFKYLHPPTLSDLENMKYHHDSILFKKYCKECKLPMKQKVEMLEDRSGIRIKNHFNFHKL